MLQLHAASARRTEFHVGLSAASSCLWFIARDSVCRLWLRAMRMSIYNNDMINENESIMVHVFCIFSWTAISMIWWFSILPKWTGLWVSWWAVSHSDLVISKLEVTSPLKGSRFHPKKVTEMQGPGEGSYFALRISWLWRGGILLGDWRLVF